MTDVFISYAREARSSSACTTPWLTRAGSRGSTGRGSRPRPSGCPRSGRLWPMSAIL
jgi:hypothetical protein